MKHLKRLENGWNGATAFAVYNHPSYNIEILIKLLTFLIQRLRTIFTFCQLLK